MGRLHTSAHIWLKARGEGRSKRNSVSSPKPHTRLQLHWEALPLMDRTDAKCCDAAVSEQPLDTALEPFHVRTMPSTGAAGGRDQPQGPLWPGLGFRRAARGDKRRLLQAVRVCQPGPQHGSGGGPESCPPRRLRLHLRGEGTTGPTRPRARRGHPPGHWGAFPSTGGLRHRGTHGVAHREAQKPGSLERPPRPESFRCAGRDHQGSTNPSAQTRERGPGP